MSSHPDADLHPVATGPAKAIVDAHQEEQPLKLYSGWFCPFVQRVWSVLEEKQIPYQYIEVNPYHKPKSLLDLNPRGLVPTLQFEGKPLFESTVVCEFLEEAWPGREPRLLPPLGKEGGGDVYGRARGRVWGEYCTSRIIPSFHRFLQFQPVSDTAGLDAARQDFLSKLKEFTSEMDSEGPFFFGKEPQLVDFIVAPWVMRLWIFDEFKGGLGLPDGEAWVERLRTWMTALQERPSIKNTTSEREYYLPIYQRYADDKAQSELAKATRLGRGVP